MSWFSEIPSVVLRRTSALCAIVAFVAVSSRAQSGREAPRAEGQNTVRIEVVESSDDLHESLQQKPALYFGAVHSPSLTFIVDDTRKYQQMDGFGASLTDSSAWLLSHKLTDLQRKEALEKLFSPTKSDPARNARRESESENHRFAVESTGLDENFRLHDSRLVVACGVCATREVLRQICPIVPSRRNPNIRRDHSE